MNCKLICFLAAFAIVFFVPVCKSSQKSAAFAQDAALSVDAELVASQTRLLKPAAAMKPPHPQQPQPEIPSTPKENAASELAATQIIGILERKLKSTDYGGIYMNGDSIIVLAVNEAAVSKVIKDNNLGAAVATQKAKYSVKQLQSTYASLEKVFAKFNMTSLSTLVKENRVEVVTVAHSDNLKKFIKSLKYGGCVKVVVSDQTEDVV